MPRATCNVPLASLMLQPFVSVDVGLVTSRAFGPTGLRSLAGTRAYKQTLVVIVSMMSIRSKTSSYPSSCCYSGPPCPIRGLAAAAIDFNFS